jgi:hypothetical protein
MTDQELVVAALRDVGSIIAAYLGDDTVEAVGTIGQLMRNWIRKN